MRGFELVENLTGEGLTETYLKRGGGRRQANICSAVARAIVEPGR